jgi:hypothetical protein
MWRWTIQDKMSGHLFLVVVGTALIVGLGLRVIGLL